ncbi:MAG: hypothetical protein H5U40_13550, partial [Polyangiaceae bacterium]|nr:hypothetical protein [Polyangiaceae bacterium]
MPSLTDRTPLVVTALAVAVSFFGCAVTPADIEHWERTQKGPGKIVAVLLSDDYPTDLRVAAAVALVDMERNDVEGIEQLGLAIDRLAEEDPAAVIAIVDGTTPELVRILGENVTPQAGAPASAPPSLQIRAKDAAFRLSQRGSDASKAHLGRAILDWFAVDYARRAMAGRVSAEQAAELFGDAGAQMLVSAMHERMPKEMLPRIVERAVELGSASTKAAAAERIIAVERAMESAEFLVWLESQIHTALSRDGAEPDPARVTGTAMLNRERFINDGALPAMRFLADQRAVADRLLEIAASNAPAGYEGEVLEAFEIRRARALSALEGKAKPEHVARLLPLALGTDVPVGVRDLAFNRLADAGSVEAIAPMWPLVQAVAAPDASREETARVRLVRMKAGELVLRLGRADTVTELLRRLPRGNAAAFEPDELIVYAHRAAEMDAPPTAEL